MEMCLAAVPWQALPWCHYEPGHHYSLSTFLINGFDRIGLSIRPAVAQLQVAGLNASYVGDTMRLSGGLRNIGTWRTHAADLRVMVRGADGTIMQETVIRPDDDVIDSQAESGFFVQLAVEAGHEAHVTVTPLANRVYR